MFKGKLRTELGGVGLGWAGLGWCSPFSRGTKGSFGLPEGNLGSLITPTLIFSFVVSVEDVGV